MEVMNLKTTSRLKFANVTKDTGSVHAVGLDVIHPTFLKREFRDPQTHVQATQRSFRSCFYSQFEHERVVVMRERGNGCGHHFELDSC